jgi:NAD(P)-dependent dehydrogenase (short-subunit alcohol dehydrogenase family)
MEILGVASCVGNFKYKPLTEMSGDEVAALVSRDVQISANIIKASAHRLSAQAAKAAAGSGGGAAGNGGSGAAAPHSALPFSSSIVVRSSSVVHRGLKHHEAFAAAKGATEALALSSAATLAQSGVRLCIVAAGLVEGSPASGEHGAPGSPTAAKSAMMYPPHALVKAEHVAAAMATALSPTLLPFTTGAVIPCDGGLTRVQAYEAPTVHV